jgi:hypothetical protein
MNLGITRVLVIAICVALAITPAVSAQYGSISGRVTDAATGLPIGMAQVSAINMDSMLTSDTWTDSSGNYFIDSLRPGFHIVGAWKEGYEENIFDGLVEVVAGEQLSDIDIELTFVGGTGIGSISGHVSDAESGLPIADAGIHVNGIPDSWSSDSNGDYFCDSIPDGTYLVSAYNAGYFPETYPESVIVAIGETTSGVDFALSPFGEPGSISGNVVDLVTGLPVENVYISAYGDFSSGYDWTDASGNYSIDSLIAGHYAVNAWSESYWEEDYPGGVTVQAGQNTPDIDFVLTPHGGPDDGIISGQVLDENTLEPIQLCLVIASTSDENDFGGAFTDSNGVYVIQGLPTNQYYVIAFADGYVVELYDGVYTWEEATPVIPDVDGIDFYLAPSDSGAGGVSGFITSGGQPVEGAMVYAEEDGNMRGSARSASDGSYAISELSPGIYFISASMVSYHDATFPEQLEIGYDQVTGINISLEPMGGCDPDGDGTITISDAVFLVAFIFGGGAGPEPTPAGDVDCNGIVNISDAVYLISYIFGGGPAPCAEC